MSYTDFNEAFLNFCCMIIASVNKLQPSVRDFVELTTI